MHSFNFNSQSNEDSKIIKTKLLYKNNNFIGAFMDNNSLRIFDKIRMLVEYETKYIKLSLF